jgi:hypothetical protein
VKAAIEQGTEIPGRPLAILRLCWLRHIIVWVYSIAFSGIAGLGAVIVIEVISLVRERRPSTKTRSCTIDLADSTRDSFELLLPDLLRNWSVRAEYRRLEYFGAPYSRDISRATRAQGRPRVPCKGKISVNDNLQSFGPFSQDILGEFHIGFIAAGGWLKNPSLSSKWRALKARWVCRGRLGIPNQSPSGPRCLRGESRVQRGFLHHVMDV